MRLIEEVDLPRPLIDAHLDGKLVLFVGAGISLDYPSSLPTFDGLAEELAELAQAPFNVPNRIDEYLGRLERLIDVKAHTAARVSRPDSLPNDLHHALARLATSGAVPRIITTNFDDHVAESAKAHGSPIKPLYVGPALPNGRSFRGLVHLHGRAKTNVRELVVTDRDFGRAYLTEAWATRFLQDVFVNSTVLFVGYSHNDLVMDYLAMGLPSDTKRYALVETSDDSRWSRLDVEVITFPDKDYGSIARLFNAWAEFATESPLSTRERVHEIVSDNSPDHLSITQREYLQWAVSTVIGAQSFAERATDARWLVWLRSEETFIRLFRLDASNSRASSILADWYGQLFVADPTRQNIALDTIRVLGGELSRQLMSTISWALRGLHEVEPQMVDPWRIFIESRLHLLTGPNGPLLVAMREEVRSNARTLALLRRAVIPQASLASAPWTNVLGDDDVAAPKKPSMTLTWSIPVREIRRLWADAEKDLSANAIDIVEIFEQALLDAVYHEASFDEKSATWTQFKRASIAKHTQNRDRSVEDVLIDGLRDSALATPHAFQLALIERWTNQHRPAIFRRLGMHLIVATNLLSTHAETDQALSVLFDSDLKHEVFELLAHIAESDEEDEIRRLVDTVQAREPLAELAMSDDRRLRQNERQKFDRLDWIARHASSGGAPEAFRLAQDANPDMLPRPNPDHGTWFSSGVWGGVLPMVVEDFIRLMDQDQDRAMREVVHDYPENNFSEPTWDDALQLMRTVVATRPDLGKAMLDWSQTNGGPLNEEIDDQVFRGWEEAPADGAALRWSVILTEMMGRPGIAVGAEARMELLAKFAAVPLEDREPGTTELGRRVAEATLDALKTSFSPPQADWWATANNTWPGALANYWLREAIALHSANEPVIAAIAGSTAGLFAQEKVGLTFAWFLASELLNYWLMDETFARTRIADLLMGNGPYSLELQEAAWDGYLHAKRQAPEGFINDDYFRRLAEIRTWASIQANSQAKEAHLEWIAVGLFRAEVHDETRDHIVDSYVVNSDIDGLRAVLEKAVWLMKDTAETGNSFTWTPWLSVVIARRVAGIPRRLGMDEAAAWSNLALHAGDQTETSLVALRGVLAPLSPDSPSTPIAEDEEFSLNGRATAIASSLTERARATAEIDDQAFYTLHEFVRALRRHISGDELEAIVESAMHAGRPEAVAWLAE